MSSTQYGFSVSEYIINNPFRVLGMPVNADDNKLAMAFERLTELCASGNAELVSSPFDLNMLPDFERTVKSVEASHAKASNSIYRCFAFADASFAPPETSDEVINRLENISCYDDFLGCYIWLLIFDRDMFYKGIWVRTAKYIDELLQSQSYEWKAVFDHRFPDEKANADFSCYESFYSAFCESILLPLKELSDSGEESDSASEIVAEAMLEHSDAQPPTSELFSELNSLAEACEQELMGLGIKEPPKSRENVRDITESNTGSVSLIYSLYEESMKTETNEVSLTDGALKREPSVFESSLKKALEENKRNNEVLVELDTSKTFGTSNLKKDEKAVLIMDEIGKDNRRSSVTKTRDDEFDAMLASYAQKNAKATEGDNNSDNLEKSSSSDKPKKKRFSLFGK